MIHFTKAVSKIFNLIKDLIFTVHCPYCGKVIDRNKNACNNCNNKFPEVPVVRYAAGGYICVSPFPYSDIFRKAVIDFKFHNCSVYAIRFAPEMVRVINQMYSDKTFDVITCVPMHKDSLRERGYNQAELLAQSCAELMGIEYAQLLVKTKKNKAQHSIKASERAKNVRGVYSPADKDLIKNKRILIIDDIITTGNTLGECARILTKYKCGEISCCTLCASMFG